LTLLLSAKPEWVSHFSCHSNQELTHIRDKKETNPNRTQKVPKKVPKIHEAFQDGGGGAKSEMIRRLRLGDLRKLLRDRNGPAKSY